MQLVVLGMHRSGTSLLARLLNMMGAYFGSDSISIGSNEENRKGFWERKDIVALNEDTLQALNADWYDVSNLKFADLQTPPFFTNRAAPILRELDAHRPWMIKDPRLCVLFPLWRPLLHRPVCLHVYRSPIQIAESLKTRNGFPLHFGIALWEKYNLAAFESSLGLPRLIVHHASVIKDPVAVVRQLYDELSTLGIAGLRCPNDDEITSFVDARLFRARASKSLQCDYLNSQQQRIVKAFEDGDILQWEHMPQLSRSAAETLQSYAELAQSTIVASRAKDLARRIEELDKEKLEYKGRIAQLSARVEELDVEKLAFRGRISELSQRIEELDEEKMQFKATISKLCTTIDSLEQFLEKIYKSKFFMISIAIKNATERPFKNKRAGGTITETKSLLADYHRWKKD